MKLFYSPGTCSLSPHIALHEAALSFELVRVDLRTRKSEHGDSYLAQNPKGYVPALLLDDGELLTEGAPIVRYLARLAAPGCLGPEPGTKEYRRFDEWLHFIATELHKGMSPFYNPKANPEFRESLGERLIARFQLLEAAVAQQPYLLGERFSAADGYAYYVLRAWQQTVGADLETHPTLLAYFRRLEGRPSVAAALTAQGLSPLK